MTIDADLLQKVFSLPLQERAELASELIRSLEGDESDPDEEALANEIESRIAAMDRGEVTPIDGHESIERVRRALRAKKA